MYTNTIRIRVFVTRRHEAESMRILKTRLCKIQSVWWNSVKIWIIIILLAERSHTLPQEGEETKQILCRAHFVVSLQHFLMF